MKEERGDRQRHSQAVSDAKEGEARQLRERLEEYDGYLKEMRTANRKNVETLDVITRYTDQSAEGIQALAGEGASGMQKLAVESLEGISRLSEEYAANLRKFTQDEENRMVQLSAQEQKELTHLAEEALEEMQHMAQESLAYMMQVAESDIRAADRMDEIRDLVSSQNEGYEKRQKQTEEYSHRENVKVYRNVQAVVVDELKKQTQELKRTGRRIGIALGVTLALTLANLALVLLTVFGLLG